MCLVLYHAEIRVQVREAHFYYLVFILLTEGLREGRQGGDFVFLFFAFFHLGRV